MPRDGVNFSAMPAKRLRFWRPASRRLGEIAARSVDMPDGGLGKNASAHEKSGGLDRLNQ